MTHTTAQAQQAATAYGGGWDHVTWAEDGKSRGWAHSGHASAADTVRSAE
jgi:hypothetical protein